MGISLKDIKDFFGFKSLSEFSAEYKQLSEKDRDEIKTGIENGSLTY